VIEAYRVGWQDSIQAGGILVKNAHGRVVPRKMQENTTLMSVNFVPYDDKSCAKRCAHEKKVNRQKKKQTNGIGKTEKASCLKAKNNNNRYASIRKFLL